MTCMRSPQIDKRTCSSALGYSGGMAETSQPRSDLGILVLLAYQGFVRRLHQEMARQGYDDLGRSDGVVFRMLNAQPRTVSDLAGRLEITKQGTAQIIDD